MRYLIISIFAILSFTVQSQEISPAEQVEVIKNFEARLADAEKISVSPKLPTLDTTKKVYQYNINTSAVNLEYQAPSIRPIAMRPDKPSDAYNGYAMLGFGTPNSPIGELAYQFVNPGWYQLGIDLRHHSANNDKRLANQRFSESDLNINGNIILENEAKVGGRLGYSQNDYYLFGYNHEDTSFTADESKRRFNLLELGASIQNNSQYSNFSYRGQFDIYQLSDNFATKENAVIADLEVQQLVNQKHQLGLNLNADLSTTKDTSSRNLINLSAIPSFQFNQDNYQLKLGANFTSSTSGFGIFPVVNVSSKIMGTSLIAFAGAEGGLTKNNFKTLSDYNPYLVSKLDSITNTKYTRYFAGVKGSYKGLDYHFEANYKSFDALAFYVMDHTDMRRFNVMYDNGNMIQLKGSVLLNPLRNIELSASLAKNFYNLEREDRPWHLPSLEANATGKYKSNNDKLHLRAELYAENGVPVQDLESPNGRRSLGLLMDISLAGDYYFTKNIGAFINLNNLTNNKRMRWENYKSFGFNVKAGIQARF